jgi:hypothetical protein
MDEIGVSKGESMVHGTGGETTALAFFFVIGDASGFGIWQLLSMHQIPRGQVIPLQRHLVVQVEDVMHNVVSF